MAEILQESKNNLRIQSVAPPGVFIWGNIAQGLRDGPQKLKQFADIVCRFLLQKRRKFDNLTHSPDSCRGVYPKGVGRAISHIFKSGGFDRLVI